MPEIPTVQTFLGFIDLRSGCLVTAAIRLVVSVILFIIVFFELVYDEDALIEEVIKGTSAPAPSEDIVSSTTASPEITELSTTSEPVKTEEKSTTALEVFVAIFLAIFAAVLAANAVVCYWYIQGVTANKTRKMKYYLWVEIVIIVLYLMTYLYSPLHLERLTAAIAESYIYVCSNSLYQQCLLSDYSENINNATEYTAMREHTAPPSDSVYNNYDEEMQLQQKQSKSSNPFNQ